MTEHKSGFAPHARFAFLSLPFEWYQVLMQTVVLTTMHHHPVSFSSSLDVLEYKDTCITAGTEDVLSDTSSEPEKLENNSSEDGTLQ